jgi:hypothetical protein
MSRPELPPRYVNVPSGVVYDQGLSSGAFQTYVQLRGLAWGKQESPTVSIDRLMELTGKGQSTLYGHMALLRSRGVLLFRPAAKGSLILSFEPVERSFPCNEREGGVRESNDLEKPINLKPPPHTYRSSKDHNDDISLGKDRGMYVEGGLLINSTVQELGQSDSADSASGEGPIGIYKSLSRVKLNSAQRKMITEQVSDPDLWRETVEHWMGHGWNSRNVSGMLNLYLKGGPTACLYCGASPRGESSPREPYQREIIRELLEEEGY